MRVRTLAAAVLGSGLLLGGLSARAADWEGERDPHALHGSLSLGGGLAPDYEGSNHYQAVPAPAARLTWRGFGLSTRGTSVQLDLLPPSDVFGGPLFNYRFGRSSVADSRVDRLPGIDGAFEAGAFFGVKLSTGEDPRENFVPMVEFLHDVSGTHDGWLATGRISQTFVPWRPLSVRVGVSTTYASETYEQTYFGVSQAGAAASGLAPYSPGGGFKDVSVSAGFDFSLSKSWSVGPTLVYKRLLGDAADSPIVRDAGSADQFVGFLGTTWRF
ncbi:Outer membrane scaffolding protein for murein synthesis, MipA/OmpV family [Tistlia consotensis]|uniref:Outer membrane scaffolding protein for murein synthesis, MipA/OmpV family n=1 Tax=Tistlia consotensis USBA 355 TaxID=560819 RepID=A0A1Y6CG23_9PROT|nr:MipA/OmpV family protein [Tistlia consotensis]SMF53783.1 Outer membrane scaffolding protein for murein synthesis, MipA/OmpV family [Tistlia consotensis USBA 355]SNR86008.1 Outer membrane scaffolding protein for murein synthesis, MipA/OmpV family [Tistlia consotensis]